MGYFSHTTNVMFTPVKYGANMAPGAAMAREPPRGPVGMPPGNLQSLKYHFLHFWGRFT